MIINVHTIQKFLLCNALYSHGLELEKLFKVKTDVNGHGLITPITKLLSIQINKGDRHKAFICCV